MTEYTINDDLLESILILIEEYISNNMKLYMFENFTEELKTYVCSFFDFNINKTLKYALNYYFSNVIPKRSYNNTFIRNRKQNNIKKILLHLKNTPQPDQRTEQWYEFRYLHLTASSIWKALLSNTTQNQLIYSKCKPLCKTNDNYSLESTLHWGHKYEPLSIMWYEHTYKTKITDYGCIPHNTLDFLAASPDGINTLESSKRYGRMLEVKNIINREINGNPKLEYWVQMQVQMEVCGLNECDFLETRFIEYNDKEEFMKDGDFKLTVNKKLKGIFMLFMKDEEPCYEYALLHLSQNEFETWETDIKEKNKDNIYIKHIYWLDEVSCILVLRNKKWFQCVKQDFVDIWNTIQKKRLKAILIELQKRQTTFKNECQIHLKEMDDVLNIDTEEIKKTDISELLHD